MNRVGDIVECKSLYPDPDLIRRSSILEVAGGEHNPPASCIFIGQRYEVLRIDYRNGEEFLVVKSTVGPVPYHYSHFINIKEERKKKLEKY